jgi:hypothetical protein
MRFRLDQLTGSTLERAAAHFETHGFFMLEGVADAVTRHLKPIIAERMMVEQGELERILEPDNPPLILTEEVRQRMSRITSSPALQDTLLSNFSPMFRRLLGPFVQVSSTFHGQFKGGDAPPVSKGGYDPKAKYLEVQGQYLIHQDFAGASLPTSPCGVTLWTPLNSCPDWNLRIYPGSHRHGLLCQEWMKLDDPRLAAFGDPLDLTAEYGTAVVFNALLLHSSSKPGFRRRVSCDIRFFPLCGFLPSAVHVLGEDPLGAFRRGLASGDGPTLRAPYLEGAGFMGLATEPVAAAPYSILNWANFVIHTERGEADAALADLTRFTNAEQGIDGVDAYATKFHGRSSHRATLEGLLERLRAMDPAAPEVAALERRVSGMTAVPA